MRCRIWRWIWSHLNTRTIYDRRLRWRQPVSTTPKTNGIARLRPVNTWAALRRARWRSGGWPAPGLFIVRPVGLSFTQSGTWTRGSRPGVAAAPLTPERSLPQRCRASGSSAVARRHAAGAIMTGAMFEPLTDDERASAPETDTAREPDNWRPILPVPEVAPHQWPSHKLGKASASWPYRDAASRLLAVARRKTTR